MSWVLHTPSLQSGEPKEALLPNEGTVYVVTSPFASVAELWVVRELQPALRQLGQITIDRSGAKLRAVGGSLNVLSAQAFDALSTDATLDPRTEGYELKPETESHFEAIFIRHGDMIGSVKAPNVLTCRFNRPEIQVNSSAAEADAVDRSEVDSVVGAPDDETEDEIELDLDGTTIAVSATQAKSQATASPRLSNQQRIVVQETPTVDRIDRDTKFWDPSEKENEDQREDITDGPLKQGGHQMEAELFSTARTAKSQLREVESVEVESAPTIQAASMDSSAVSTLAPPTATSHTEAGFLDVREIEQPSGSAPKEELLRLPKKRSSPFPDGEHAEVKSRSRNSKRNKPIATDQVDSPTPRKSTSVKVVIESAQPRASKRRKPTSDDSIAQDASPQRSQRSQADASTPRKNKGEAPRVAFSHSAITLNGQAVKFLKKHGGAVAESVDDSCDVLCVKDGPLTKTMKLLESIARGIPIVTDKWLLDSATQEDFLPFEDYRPSVPGQEASWKFTLDKVWGKPQKPFEGYTLHFTSELQKSYTNFDEIKQVCQTVGATVSGKKSAAANRIVLAKDSGDKDFAKFTQDGVKCFSKDLLTNSILRGEFDLESEEFLIKVDEPSASADTPKSTRKKSRKS